ncbi:hypothetical protein LB533_03450 [Mesorhizobium sp. BR1-1-13]|uniref:hypothetical protein n=1 Tax=Mesorhizobium sp. BR1-1-13 TaxID=2876656 RepID=UPI001CD06C8A|nr:hypothetical protein [Mesorhizobium sp. BR1-1-13]MBZ9940155.1 hypothetical protein [Mesorhizobium sp. BR1-1-13]
MTFKSSHLNPLSQLVELKTHLLDDAEGQSQSLVVELRANPQEVEDKIGTISVEIREATLALDISGMEIVPKTRIGQSETAVPALREVHRETTIATVRASSEGGKAGVSVGITASGPEAGVQLGVAASDSSSASITRRDTEMIKDVFHPVRAQSGDRWKVSMENGGALDATFLDGDVLCKLSRVKGANLVGVESRIVVKQKHINVKLDADKGFLSLRFPRSANQAKIMKVLINKSLNDKSGNADFAGEITFSKSSSCDED